GIYPGDIHQRVDRSDQDDAAKDTRYFSLSASQPDAANHGCAVRQEQLAAGHLPGSAVQPSAQDPAADRSQKSGQNKSNQLRLLRVNTQRPCCLDAPADHKQPPADSRVFEHQVEQQIQSNDKEAGQWERADEPPAESRKALRIGRQYRTPSHQDAEPAYNDA